jgi:hypothetical protein
MAAQDSRAPAGREFTKRTEPQYPLARGPDGEHHEEVVI